VEISNEGNHLNSIIIGEWKKPSSKITKTEKETDGEARARWHGSTIDWNRADGVKN